MAELQEISLRKKNGVLDPLVYKKEADKIFEIPFVLFLLAHLFIFAGLVLGFLADLRLDLPVVALNDTLAGLGMLLFFTLGLSGKMTRSRALGASVILSLYVFYVGLAFTLSSGNPLSEQLFLFNMNMATVFVLVSGFLVNSRISLLTGGSTLFVSIFCSFWLGTSFLLEYLPMLIVLIAGYTVIIYYYRKKLETLVPKVILNSIKTEEALKRLKDAQERIIKQERLASMGTLTAGIAHEIRNPLNFVNNFAESSIELFAELAAIINKKKDCYDSDDWSEAEYLLGELGKNMEEIHEHGLRGNSIVQTMLLHVRTGESIKTPSDLHQILKEAVNLAFHGYKATEHDFACSLHYDFWTEPILVKIAAHEMSRVFLNLCSNAFYAMHEKSKKKAPTDYLPSLTIKTSFLYDAPGFAPGLKCVHIEFSDTGPGIPEAVQEKLFTPFFTTKPSGEGTGLGLSMSYEIVHKGHGGTLEVLNRPEGGAVFSITFPAVELT